MFDQSSGEVLIRDAGKAPRYRLEAGVHCIDVRVGKVQQLFDNRDPAPFLARDLDPHLVEYLRDSAEDLLGEDTVRVVFWLETPCTPGALETAYRGHFAFLLEQIRRHRRRRRRTGEVALALAFLLLAALQSLAQLVSTTVSGPVGAGLGEGMVIMSWVFMWRPVEVLFFDWIPVRHERKIVSKLLQAPIEVRIGNGPDVPLIHRAATEAGEAGLRSCDTSTPPSV
jgi:hypothetical protein